MSKQTTQIPENENPKLKSTFQIRQPKQEKFKLAMKYKFH